MRTLLAIAIVLLPVAGPAAAQSPDSAADLLHAALDAMGGEARWRALGSIRVEGVGHGHALEQSERPEGPWVTTYRQFAELRDLAGGRLRRTQEEKGFWQADRTAVTTLADREAAIFERGDRAGPAFPTRHRTALQSLDLSPERVLLTALAAPDLAAVGDTTLQGVVHRVVTFTWDGRPARAVLEGAAERFPGKPVKAVVSTSDAWPHVGGVREFVAADIPVHALDLNLPLLERLIAAPHHRDPDLLARSPRKADLRAVTGATTIGEGPNRIELLPVRGEGGERMMVAWLPGRRILYASDLVQIGPDGTAFWPEYLLEVAEVVDREGLEPETVFAMHTPPMPWEQVAGILAGAAEATPPAR